MDEYEIGKTIKELREGKKIKQKELAEYLSVDESLISKWESGQTNIGMPYLIRMSELFEMTLDDMISYQEKKRKELEKTEQERRQLIERENQEIKEKIRNNYYCQVWDKKLGYERIYDEKTGEYISTQIKRDFDGEVLTLYQKEDPSIVLYGCFFRIEVDREATLYTFSHSEWKKQPLFEDRKNCWGFDFDFSNPITKIKIAFDVDGIDDYEIEVKYVYADVESFQKKKEEERRQELLKKIGLVFLKEGRTTNVYFSPASQDYQYGVIELYRKPIVRNGEYVLLKKYRLSDGECIWMDNLIINTNNDYCFVLKQFDKDGNLIVESDKKSF